MDIYTEIPLPFEIPVKNDLKLISGYQFFKIYMEFQEYEKTIINYPEVVEVQKCTLLKIKYFPDYPNFATLDMNEVLRVVILDSLNYINNLIDATRNNFALDYLYNITIWDLPTNLIVNVNGEEYLYITKPQELIREPFIINQEGLSLIGRTLGLSDNYSDFFLVDKFYDSGKSLLYKEKFVDSIIYFQTSFEIFIRMTIKIILKQENVSDQRIEKAAKMPFRNLVEDHIGKYLKCNLNFKTSEEINPWYEDLYLIRNDIVHGGRTQLNGEEAYRAYDSYVKAKSFISDKMVEHKYIDKNKNIDLNLFKKNTPDLISRNEFIKHLKSLGLVHPDSEML